MLTFGWRRRPLQPQRVLDAAIGSLELVRDVVSAAADASNDRRFGTALARLDRAIDVLRGRA